MVIGESTHAPSKIPIKIGSESIGCVSAPNVPYLHPDQYAKEC